MKPLLVLISSLYMLSVFVVFAYSFTRKVKRLKLFVISFFLTPLAGSVLVWIADKKIDYEVLRFKCTSCHFTFTESHDHCPMCEKDGKRNKLKKVIRVMT